jgi:hypothetical protein
LSIDPAHRGESTFRRLGGDLGGGVAAGAAERATKGHGRTGAEYPAAMSSATADARQEMLGVIAGAVDDLAVALAALGEAYELLDDTTADRLEEQLFQPVVTAYGRAKRTHDDFAGRHGLVTRTFAPAAPGHPSQGVRGFLDGAVSALARADHTLAELQDSLMPIEIGDEALRAGLSEVRRGIGELPSRARQFVRVLGR